MESFVRNWGYLAVFFGSLIEGESVILPAGYFAAQGLLNLYAIIGIAFLGTLLADQGLFFVGHLWGRRILSKFTFLERTSEKAFMFLKEYGTFYILTFRFIYGVRIISPVVIGAAGVSFKRFAILNFIAAAIWSFLSCGAGYFFGSFLMHVLSPFQRFLVLGALGALSLSWLVWKGYLFYKKEFS